MRATWVFLLALGVVSADIGLGYHYKVPETTYGVPSYQFGGNSGLYNSAYSGSFGSSDLGSGLLSGYHGSVFPTASAPSTSGLGNTFYQSSSSSSGNAVPVYQYAASAGNSGAGTGFQTQYTSSSQYQTSNQEKHQQHYQIQQQPTQVFKHFYVHAAPEEPEEVKPRAPIVLPPAQKHYKIIFVKTPTENHRSQAVVPVQPQNEEKTIVYVLVKKPEDQHEVIVPKIEQKPPSKPEVYFIKYKNKEDSQAVINNIVKDYNKGQQVSIVNAGAGENVFNTASGLGLGETSFQSTPVLSDSSFNSAAGFSNIQYDTPVQSNAAVAQTFGTALNLASTNSDNNEATIASSIATPLTVSSTASTIDYDNSAAISTSQGIPHESYGPPKFRVNN